MEAEIPNARKVYNLFPYFLLILAALGIGVTIMLGRIDLTYASLAIVIPLVLAAVVLIANRHPESFTAAIPAIGKVLFPHLFLINVLIFVTSLIVLLAFPTRPLGYFILMSVFSGVIFLQILSRRPGWTDALILGEIVFLSLNLLWGVTLKYPLYFLDTDSMGHLNMIQGILDPERVGAFILNYQYYALYHVFIAMGVKITGMPTSTALFVFMGIAWQAGILFSYLIFKNLAKSRKFALIACLIFATSSQILFYGSYSIARSLAFVFLMCWLYLIFGKAGTDNRYLALSFIAMTAMILSHHVNVLLVIPVLFLVYLVQLVFKRFRPVTLIKPMFIVLVVIASFSYMLWVATDMAVAVIPGTIEDLVTTQMELVGDFTAGYGLAVMLGALYYSIVLLLCLLGMNMLLNSNYPPDFIKRAGIFAFAAFPLLLVYVPGFVNLIPMSELIFAQRLQLMVTPFIAFLTAFGIAHLLNWGRRKRRQLPGITGSAGGAVVVLVIMTFTSLISTGNAQDYDRFPHTSTIDTPYFTNAELDSFTFIREKADTAKPLYSDYQTWRNVYILNDFNNKHVLTGGDISYIEEGYISFRAAELERKTALTYSPDGRAREVIRYKIDPSQPQQNILNNLNSKNKVYSSGAAQVYIAEQ